MGIKWQEGSVCFAGGSKWLLKKGDKEYLLFNSLGCYTPVSGDLSFLIERADFQLNTIKLGDYIEASELNTEQKYNDAVEVFELFGFEVCVSYSTLDLVDRIFVNAKGEVCGCYAGNNSAERKLTYPQLMAIGELKRLEIERDKEPQFGKNEDGSMKLIKSNFSASSNKYEREITDRQGNSATVDVYDVLKAFDVTCPATQHALKKLLCSGLRGHKDLQTDLLEAKESITRAIELND